MGMRLDDPRPRKRRPKSADPVPAAKSSGGVVPTGGTPLTVEQVADAAAPVLIALVLKHSPRRKRKAS